MNDLDYSTWMKFQKSFFHYSSFQQLIDDFILFFTKEKWNNLSISNSAIFSDQDFAISEAYGSRLIEINHPRNSIINVVKNINKFIEENKKFDFILLDLRNLLSSQSDLEKNKSALVEDIFPSLRELLVKNKYCCILVNHTYGKSMGYPTEWVVAQISRGWLKLRDEKICLCDDAGSIFYCLVFESENDERVSISEIPKIDCRDVDLNIPSWLIPKPPPRKAKEIVHPAKFPETLIEEFIRIFSKPGDVVFDPMVGSGSSVIAASRMKRYGIGVDINPDFVKISKERVMSNYIPSLDDWPPKNPPLILQGDALHLGEIDRLRDVQFDYVITSPPYWSMLTNKGSENQKNRRKKNLPLYYSDDDEDVGNIELYDDFIDKLILIYSSISGKMKSGSYMTIIVKNVKREHTIYPLAWDLVFNLSNSKVGLSYVGNTFWLQDDIPLKPFAVGTHWVSNVLHQYCLHFVKN